MAKLWFPREKVMSPTKDLLVVLLVSIHQGISVSAQFGGNYYPDGQKQVQVVPTQVFTQLASSQVSWVNIRMNYDEAETYCKGLNSNLIEIWTDSEWDEVKN